MMTPRIETPRLILISQTVAEARAMVAAMSEEDQAQLSPAWRAQLDGEAPVSPWMLGFSLTRRDTDSVIGHAGFKGPPDSSGYVELAYGLAPAYQGSGYATEAAGALVAYAFAKGEVNVVRAHTLPVENASGRVLTKCGFTKRGEVVDPEDGLVWRWEITRS